MRRDSYRPSDLLARPTTTGLKALSPRLGVPLGSLERVSDIPEVKFVRSDNADIAYQVVGSGDRNIVLLVGWASHLEVLWELAEARRFIERLAGMGRLVIFDKRGTGLSDRPPTATSIEDMVPDLIAVMDAAQADDAVLVGWSDGAAMAVEATARHPERVRSLVLAEALASAIPSEDHPWGPDPAMIEGLASAIELGMWGQAGVVAIIAPSAANDSRIMDWFKRMERMSATPRMAADLLRRTMAIDQRDRLPDIRVPCLLLHRRGNPLIPSEAMRWFADQLPDGRYVELDGDELPGYLGDVDGLMDEIEDFLVGTRTGSQSDRRVATIVFNDIVRSTEQASAVGDRTWAQLLEEHRNKVRRIINRQGGNEIGTAGDGFLILFDSPSNALRFASEVTSGDDSSEFQTRTGVHAGEITTRENDVSGMAVHIAARVEATAIPGEIWVTATIKTLLLGSEFEFESTGEYELKGVPDVWELYRLVGRRSHT